MCSSVIFVDIDGPMIPIRAAFLPNQTGIHSVFDPCATSMLLELLKSSNAKIVVSSSWRTKGKDPVFDLFQQNGIDQSLIHEDWATPILTGDFSRAQEIASWLSQHPEVVNYVAIDDDDLDVTTVPKAVKCSAYEGFSWRNYLEAQAYLTIDSPVYAAEMKSFAELLKIYEVKRIVRRGEDKPAHLDALINELTNHTKS